MAGFIKEKKEKMSYIRNQKCSVNQGHKLLDKQEAVTLFVAMLWIVFYFEANFILM